MFLRILPWWIKTAAKTTDFDESIYSYREFELVNYWAGIYSIVFVKERVVGMMTRIEGSCVPEIKIYTKIDENVGSHDQKTANYSRKSNEYREVHQKESLNIFPNIPDDFELAPGQSFAVVINFQPIFNENQQGDIVNRKTSLENLEMAEDNMMTLQKSLVLILSTKNNGKRVLEVFGYNIKMTYEGELKKFGGLSEISMKRDINDFNVRIGLVQKLVLQELGVQKREEGEIFTKTENPMLLDFKKHPLAHRHKDQFQKYKEQQGEQRKINAKRETENDICQNEKIIHSLTLNCYNTWYWRLINSSRPNPLKYRVVFSKMSYFGHENLDNKRSNRF